MCFKHCVWTRPARTINPYHNPTGYIHSDHPKNRTQANTNLLDVRARARPLLFIAAHNLGCLEFFIKYLVVCMGGPQTLHSLVEFSVRAASSSFANRNPSSLPPLTWSSPPSLPPSMDSLAARVRVCQVWNSFILGGERPFWYVGLIDLDSFLCRKCISAPR